MKHILLVIALILMATPSYAIQLTGVEGKFECPKLTWAHNCAQKYGAQFRKNHTNVVEQKGETLIVQLFNGEALEVDVVDVKNKIRTVVEITNNTRFLTMVEIFKINIKWFVIDRQTGHIISTKGYPLFSPNEKTFVSSANGLNDKYFTPNHLNIYKLTDEGFKKTFSAHEWEKGDRWGPVNVAWLNNTKVQFEKDHFNQKSTDKNFIHEEPYYLGMINGQWQILSNKYFPLVQQKDKGLEVQLLNGKKYTFQDEEWKFTDQNITKDERYLIIYAKDLLSMHNHGSWLMFDRKLASSTNIGADPLFSPDGKSFVSSSFDLEAGYSPNIFDIYALTDEGVVHTFNAIKVSAEDHVA